MDFTTLLPAFGNLGFTIAAFLLALLVIVAIHEFGHYIVGRWCGIHADVYSLGFGPVLWSRKDRRGTRWQIAALPLGGYVRFLGDSNAASVGGEVPQGVNPRHTINGAPLWARVLTIAAGPVANFLLTIVIFICLFASTGRMAEPLSIETLTPLPAAWESGLQPGDELITVNGAEVSDMTSFYMAASAADYPAEYTLRRDGSVIRVAGPHPLPPVVGQVSPRSAAWSAGIRAGDVITAVDGAPVTAFSQIVPMVEAGQGAEMALTIWRDGETRQVTLTPRRTDLPTADGFETRWLIGVTAGSLFAPTTETPAPVELVTRAVAQLWFILQSSLSGMWHMLTGAISTCNLSSPIGIADTSGVMAAQGAVSYISFIAFLSAAIGLLNLLPIPILDGGHLVFHAWEAVTGRPPSERVIRLAIRIGMALLFSLMGMALLNDLFLCR